MSDETDDLGPKGDERDEIDDCKGAKKEPADEKVLGRLDVFSPETSGDCRKNGAMVGDEAVGTLGRS